jgi:hypothetical protein
LFDQLFWKMRLLRQTFARPLWKSSSIKQFVEMILPCCD